MVPGDGHVTDTVLHQAAVKLKQVLVENKKYIARRRVSAANGLVIAASVVVSVTVVVLRLHPVYGGLSGLCCGICAALILAMVLDSPNGFLGYALAVLFCVYLGLAESLVAGIRVAHEAHWAGALSGMASEGIRFYWTRKSWLKEKLRSAVPDRPTHISVRPFNRL